MPPAASRANRLTPRPCSSASGEDTTGGSWFWSPMRIRRSQPCTNAGKVALSMHYARCVGGGSGGWLRCLDIGVRTCVQAGQSYLAAP